VQFSRPHSVQAGAFPWCGAALILVHPNAVLARILLTKPHNYFDIPLTERFDEKDEAGDGGQRHGWRARTGRAAEVGA
jgi:hypothetical protein